MNENKNIDDRIRKMLANQRKDVMRGICDRATAMFVLGVDKNKFYEILDDEFYGLKRSKVRGKYMWSSVLVAFKRLHGFSYKEAISVPSD